MSVRWFPLILAAACRVDPDPMDTDAPASPPSWCETNGLSEVAFDAAGPYGILRHQRSDGFWVVHRDGSEWSFEEEWSGCDSYVFIPDAVDGRGSDPIWAFDLEDLLVWSPNNTHYFFSSRKRDEAADASLADLEGRIDEALAALDLVEATGWRARLHVVEASSGWLSDVYRGIGSQGWAIDRAQNVRGLGSFADVDLYTGAAGWPWDPNLAYAALDAHYFNMEAARDTKLAAETATVVPLWRGEVISEFADLAVTLPSAAEMATFDTFEVDIDMRCPDPEEPEFGNCGAWDYLANLYVQDGDDWIELGRMITSYHRETHWVVDLTPMMAHLLDGGERTFRWSWAPPWNVQPTETRLTLRFSNQGKGYAPRKATLVATGGGFGSAYNTGRVPAEVPISAAARHVELWALITGHGADASTGCAEFCNHQHEFTVGTATYVEEYPIASDDSGCRDNGVAVQMTPNQWGTWWFGRGGWCPGQPVLPFAVDVTADVTPGGTASVGYRGLFKNKTPPDGGGNIVLNAWLVEYQ